VAAYLIFDFEIRDSDSMREYSEKVPGIVRKFGGKYLVRGGTIETVEGDWRPSRIVVLEFPSVEQAKRYHDSEEYAPFQKVRLKAGPSRAILVEGVQEPV
jgi:uncharacterized protein (DUF1330 family)